MRFTQTSGARFTQASVRFTQAKVGQVRQLKSYLFKWYLSAFWRVYGIVRTFVPGPKHPLANKLFDMFGVNHGTVRLWPISWHVA